MIFLKQSTAIEVKVGPFLDSTDGVTAEAALTITSAEVLLAKGAGDWTAKTEATSLVHESNGWYRCLLDTTDTNTLGTLMLQIAESGALPVHARACPDIREKRARACQAAEVCFGRRPEPSFWDPAWTPKE